MPRLTEEQREVRCAQITDAALRCFARDGFHRTTMSDIVRESGLSPGLIYHYFASKEDVITAIAADRHDREAALHRRALSDPDPRQALSNLIRGYGEWLADPEEQSRRRVGVQVWAEALRDEKVHSLILHGADAGRDAIAALLTRAQAEGRLVANSDPAALARAFVALFQGFVLQLSWDEKADLPGYLREVERLLSLLITPAGEER